MKKVLLLILIFSQSLQAQDLMDMLVEEASIEYTQATFKDSRIVNAQSNEQAAKGELKFMVQHRFGPTNLGGYALWGLDDSKVRMGFEYGLSPSIALKLGRSSDQKEFDLSAKVKALKQTQDIPFAISFYTATFFKHPSINERAKNSFNWSDQFSFANQLIFVKKVNTNLSFALLPTYLIFSKVEQANNGMFCGVGGRYKLFKRISLNAEYFYAFQEFDERQQNNLSLGFDIDTGGHVFSLHLSNSRGMNERAFLMDTSGNWLEGDVYFGFNISRVFSW
jgi:hypothetical protein